MKRYIFLLACISVLLCNHLFAVEFGAPFSDHMVIQCEKPLPVWGKAEPGEKLTVTLDNEVRECTADNNGKWAVEFSPRKASFDPVRLDVRGENSRKTCRDILVGEVWFCSGQSNMQRRLKDTKDAKTYAAQANLPHVRYAEIPLVSKDKPQDDVDTTWQLWTPESVIQLSGVAFHFGRKLAKEIDKPIGLISCSWGGSKIHAWIPQEYFSKDPAYEAGIQWFTQGKETYKKTLDEWYKTGCPGEPPQDYCSRPQNIPCALDNGMTHPMQPFAIRGAIWYQGESDAGIPDQYRTMFASLVQSWRDHWNDPTLPVYYVQLPNFEKSPPTWEPFRQMQLKLLDEIPNLGMAITIDIGDPNDIHPKNKYDVGQRLARLALYHTYGRTDVCPSGPLPEKAVRDGDRVLVSWKWACDGLKTRDGSDAVPGFELAGSDGVFKLAQARIINKNTVELTSRDVKRHAEVHYAYEADPIVNLVNSADLPASPCRLLIGK